MRVSYFDRGPLDAERNAYKFELIHAALEASRAEFGAYDIKVYPLEPTPKRFAQLMRDGSQLNLLWASPGTFISKSAVITVPFDIMQGLLSYRVCLINKNHPLALEKLTDAASLTQLNLGQGDWSDVDVYHYNDLKPRIAPSFEALFTMLNAHRFDCVPLGANEAVQVLDKKKLEYPDLALEPNLLLYYEYPSYFYVSAKHPKLAQRLTLGLNKLQKSGAFNTLFLKYHAEDLKRLKLGERKIICLKSPFIATPNQCLKPPRLPNF